MLRVPLARLTCLATRATRDSRLMRFPSQILDCDEWTRNFFSQQGQEQAGGVGGVGGVGGEPLRHWEPRKRLWSPQWIPLPRRSSRSGEEDFEKSRAE